MTTGSLTYILVGILRGKDRTRQDRNGKLSPERTRECLLQAKFQEVYRSGFQSAGLETILASAKVTKGALYHHFRHKRALGYVLVEEVIAAITHEKWVQPLRSSEDPFATLIDIIKQTSLTAEDVRGGCPLNNLAHEMSPLDEGFRTRLARVF